MSIEIKLMEHTAESCNCLQIQVGTNCPMGGDSGHGGRTVLRLTDEAGTDLRCGINGGRAEPVDSIEIVLGGDSEHDTFIEVLAFALSVLTPGPAADAVRLHSVE